MKALIVDHNGRDAERLRRLLEGDGFDAVAVNNGVDALERLRHEPFQVIIADIDLPQMDGFRLCRAVKTDPDLKDIPFLIYTADYTSVEDEALARRLGADAFFIKPMEPADFLAAVRTAIGGPGREGVEPEREPYRGEDLFDVLARTAPVGIFRVNPAGELEYVNDHWCAITGLTREAATVAAWQELLHPEDRSRVVGEWRRARSQGGVFQGEFRFRRADGGVTWVSGQANPLSAVGGSQHSYVGTLTDITRQKKLELERAEIQSKLHLSQKLEAIGTLVNGIAHDFNNLVGAIFGYAELAQRQLSQQAKIGEDLKLLLQAAERARALTGQILRFSRKQKEELKPVRIGPAVREALTLLRASMPANIRLREVIAGHVPLVLADTTQIHQVVMNLVTNALHALREKGGELEVKLEATQVHPALVALAPDLEEGDYVELCVRDTGYGIPPELLSRIFDPFFTTKPSGEGTGMGLSVVHGIVKAHGGAITVTSVVGQGTTFRIYLPAMAEPTPAPAAEPEGQQPGHGERILYVDNEKLLTEMVKRMLEILGYRPTVLENAAEALEYVRAHPDEFALVLSDIDMPEMHGAELARHLWKIRPDLPVLFVSGAGKSLTREAALHLGARDILLKPFDLHALAEAVAHALAEKTADTPS